MSDIRIVAVILSAITVLLSTITVVLSLFGYLARKHEADEARRARAEAFFEAESKRPRRRRKPNPNDPWMLCDDEDDSDILSDEESADDAKNN